MSVEFVVFMVLVAVELMAVILGAEVLDKMGDKVMDVELPVVALPGKGDEREFDLELKTADVMARPRVIEKRIAVWRMPAARED